MELYGKMNVLPQAGGTSDYEQLQNKPSINGVQLTGNKTSENLGILRAVEISQSDYDNLSTAQKTDATVIYFIPEST